MTIYELAAFPILISAAVETIISISEDIKSSAITIASPASLRERSSGCHANNRPAQSKFD
jgi:hypothetical protein